MSSDPALGPGRDLDRQPDDPRAELGIRGYAWFVARRFLKSRRTGFLSLNSLLSAFGFTLGVASLIIALSLMSGFQTDVINRIMGANAHILIYAADGAAVIREPDIPGGVVSRVEGVDGVVAAEPVVRGPAGMIGGSGTVQWTLITGIDPGRARPVTKLKDEMVSGEFADLSRPTVSGRPPAILGAKLASRLGVILGDQVQLILPRPRPAPWGVSLSRPFVEVVGLFETGYVEYDESWVFVSLADGRRMFGLADEAHWIGVRIEEPSRLEQVEARISDALGPGYWIDDVIRQNRVFFSALELEKLLMSLAVGLIVLVAALGVVSSLVLTVTQKTREIGVLVAMGADPAGVLRIFVLQGTAMGVLGTVLGALLGAGMALILDRFGLIPLNPEVYYLDSLPFRVEWRDLAWIVGTALAVALLATIYPAWRAARLDPVEALRHE